jgi:anti-anti-sigma factor
MVERSMMDQAVVVPYHPDGYTEAERAIAAAAADGVERVVLDLDGVSELDIAGVRSLIELLRRARARGVELALSIDHPEVRATLERMALDRIFPILSPEAA